MGERHRIRDLIFYSLSVSQDSKVPILFMSNPGYTKTVNVEKWAEMNGYEVTTLIGSQHTNEEVLGYMVKTAEGKLRIATPDWYDEIVEREESGQKTLLFVDELSTASEIVQGSLLQLIFSRKCGGRNYLPDSTMIVSAANYSGNLPSMMSLISPIINRFMVVNINVSIHDRDELFMFQEDWYNDMFEIKVKEGINGRKLHRFMKDAIDSLTSKYGMIDPANGGIDLGNTKLVDVYSKSGNKVLNFISTRTLHYLYKVTHSIVKLDIENWKDFYPVMVEGLIGYGTGTFKGEALKEWLEDLKDTFIKVVSAEKSGMAVMPNDEADTPELLSKAPS
jgi:hypothetical protein